MSEPGDLGIFEAHREHLRAIAHRMLGSRAEADDAVQETWLRLQRSDTASIDNLRGWLTTVIARVCLDQLRARALRREDALDPGDEPSAPSAAEHEALLADSIGVAMLVVLDTLAPAERLAFVLHDLFAIPFEEIAPILQRTPAAARQLASRARRRVSGASPADADVSRQREIVAAFLAASRTGDFTALLAVLDPDVVVRADGAAQRMGASRELRGADAAATWFKGRAAAARVVLLDGEVGAAWIPGAAPRVVFDITIARGRIAAIELLGDPAMIAALDLTILPV